MTRFQLQPYANHHGDSGVRAWSIVGDTLSVEFVDGAVYVYTVQTLGARVFETLCRTARAGRGLATTISRDVGARQVREVERLHADTTAYIDRTLGRGRWDQDVFAAGLEARIEAAAERMGSRLGRSVMWQVVTGRASRMDARAERLDAELTRRIDARSAALDVRAEALCTQVRALQSLQAALDYRFENAPLVMLKPAPAREPDGSSAPPDTTAADAPQD